MARSKSPAPRKKSKSDQKKYKELFDKIDEDGSGGIDAFELQKAMVHEFGVKLSQVDVLKMMQRADLNDDGFIDIEEFQLLMEDVKVRKEASARNRADGDSLKMWSKFRDDSIVVPLDQTVEMFNEMMNPIHTAVFNNTPAVQVPFGLHTDSNIVVHFAPGMARFFGDYVLILLALGMLFSTYNALNDGMAYIFKALAFSNVNAENMSLVIFSFFAIPVLLVFLRLATRSQSIGGFVMGLQVMDAEHQPCGTTVFLIRLVVSFLLGITFVGGLADFIFMLGSREGESLTDKIVGTHVVVIQP